jgi:hypothetical protein
VALPLKSGTEYSLARFARDAENAERKKRCKLPVAGKKTELRQEEQENTSLKAQLARRVGWGEQGFYPNIFSAYCLPLDIRIKFDTLRT